MKKGKKTPEAKPPFDYDESIRELVNHPLDSDESILDFMDLFIDSAERQYQEERKAAGLPPDVDRKPGEDPLITITTGTGFTKWQHVVGFRGSRADERRHFKALRDNSGDPLDFIERRCRKTLEDAGLPVDVDKNFLWKPDGSWREIPADRSTCIYGEEFITTLYKIFFLGWCPASDSKEGYAIRALHEFHLLRYFEHFPKHRKRATAKAFEIGALWKEAEMKGLMEPLAIKGLKFRPPKRKIDDLGKCIGLVLDDLGDDAEPRAVWNELMGEAESGLPPFDIIGIADENEPNRMYWKRRSTGEERTLSFESFKKRLNRQKEKRRTPPE